MVIAAWVHGNSGLGRYRSKESLWPADSSAGAGALLALFVKTKKIKKHETPNRGPLPSRSASGIPVHCACDDLAEIASLQPNPRNPNRHPEKQIALLAKIIRHQGWRAPIVVSERSGFVVSGHARLEAAKLLQVTHLPVCRQPFQSEADEHAHMIADNRIAELADLDRAELARLCADLDGLLEVDLTGFDSREFEELVGSLTEPKKVPHPKFEEAGELAAKWKTKRGQLWALGPHRLMCGDSADEKDLEKLKDDKRMGVAVIDPPWEETDKWSRHIMDPCVVMGKGVHIRAIPADLYRFERIIDKGRSRGMRGIHTCIWNRHGIMAQCGTDNTRPPRNVGRNVRLHLHGHRGRTSPTRKACSSARRAAQILLPAMGDCFRSLRRIRINAIRRQRAGPRLFCDGAEP